MSDGGRIQLIVIAQWCWCPCWIYVVITVFGKNCGTDIVELVGGGWRDDVVWNLRSNCWMLEIRRQHGIWRYIIMIDLCRLRHGNIVLNCRLLMFKNHWYGTKRNHGKSIEQAEMNQNCTNFILKFPWFCFLHIIIYNFGLLGTFIHSLSSCSLYIYAFASGNEMIQVFIYYVSTSSSCLPFLPESVCLRPFAIGNHGSSCETLSKIH